MRDAGDSLVVAAGLMAAGGVAASPAAQNATVLGPAPAPVPQATMTGPNLVSIMDMPEMATFHPDKQKEWR
jgi:hypothetical protein